ncbi:MAG: P-loop NTPase fold protein [Methanobacterium sp.]
MSDVNFKDPFNALGKYLLDPVDYSEYYVQRKHSPVPILSTRLKVDNKNSKLLFTGHRGSGKSTEIFRLINGLDEYFVVYYSMETEFDITDIKYTDVLLSIGFQLHKVASNSGLEIDKEITDKFAHWMEEITETRIEEFTEGTSITAGFNAYVLKFLSKIQSEDKTRREYRTKIESTTSDLIKLINTLIEKVNKELKTKLSKKGIVIIIDDLDKTDLEVAEEIFYKHSLSITQPNCKIIYTVPISLAYSFNCNQMRQNFEKLIYLPMVKTKRKNGDEDKDGVSQLRDILSSRINLDLFEPDALDILIMNTGGLIRDLLRCTADCCLSALEQDAEKISVPMVKETINGLKSDYQRFLTTEDYAKLESIQKYKTSDQDHLLMRLLHSLSVLYYQDDKSDEYWYDIHPTIYRLLEYRKLLSEFNE